MNLRRPINPLLAAVLGLLWTPIPRAPDLKDLPDTTETTLSKLRADYRNEAKFPNRRRRLRAEARDAAGYEWERGRGWVKKKK